MAVTQAGAVPRFPGGFQAFPFLGFPEIPRDQKILRQRPREGRKYLKWPWVTPGESTQSFRKELAEPQFPL